MKASPIKFALVALLLATWARPLVAADIAGTVVIKSKMRKRAVGVRYNPRYHDDRTVRPDEEDEARHVVVYLEEVDPRSFVVPSARPRMLQKDKEFRPHVLPIVAGQTVDFPNDDKIFHNVYSNSRNEKFELPEYKAGDTRERRFTSPGVVELFCGIHTTMNAYILVLQNPFFAQPDANHAYVVRGVPKGTYTLHAWHPRADMVTRTIQVPESGVVTLDLEI